MKLTLEVGSLTSSLTGRQPVAYFEEWDGFPVAVATLGAEEKHYIFEPSGWMMQLRFGEVRIISSNGHLFRGATMWQAFCRADEHVAFDRQNIYATGNELKWPVNGKGRSLSLVLAAREPRFNDDMATISADYEVRSKVYADIANRVATMDDIDLLPYA